MMKSKFDCRCLDCRGTFPYRFGIANCPHCSGEWFDVVFDLAAARSEWSREPLTSLWKYFAVLPIMDRANIVTAGEGATPLRRWDEMSSRHGFELYVKDEALKPPNSNFKDRGATLAISAFKEAGVGEFVMYSTGNIGISCSWYARQAGQKIHLFVPAAIESEKAELITAHGGVLHRITGTYDQTARAAIAFAREHNLVFDRGVKSVFRRESKKTIAYEIYEQLGGRAPDWYFQSASGGVGPLGVHKGFMELQALGLIGKVPALGCVQTAGCNPMVRSFQQGSRDLIRVDEPDTTILTLATGAPGAYPYVYDAVVNTGGTMLGVSDAAAAAAQREARAVGIESGLPACVSLAGILALAERGTFTRGSVVVWCNTGRR